MAQTKVMLAMLFRGFEFVGPQSGRDGETTIKIKIALWKRGWRLGEEGNLSKNRNTFFGNGPNTVSESTVSNTELSEFFGAH